MDVEESFYKYMEENPNAGKLYSSKNIANNFNKYYINMRQVQLDTLNFMI